MTVAERVAVYRLLAYLVSEVPDDATAEALAPTMDADTGAMQDREVAFAQLFLLPGGTPPYVRHWTEGIVDPSTVLEETMAVLGLQATDVGGRLAMDHIALVLCVVAASLEDEALAAVGPQVEDRLIGPWVDRFGAALRERAPHPFYRAVGDAFVALRDGASCASD